MKDLKKTIPSEAATALTLQFLASPAASALLDKEQDLEVLADRIIELHQTLTEKLEPHHQKPRGGMKPLHV